MLINKGQQSIEKTISLNQNIIIQRFEQQDKQIKTLKTILFIICGLIVISTTAILVLK